MALSEAIAIGEIAVQLAPYILVFMRLVSKIFSHGKNKKKIVTKMVKTKYDELKEKNPDKQFPTWEEVEPEITKHDGVIETLYQEHKHELEDIDPFNEGDTN